MSDVVCHLDRIISGDIEDGVILSGVAVQEFEA